MSQEYGKQPNGKKDRFENQHSHATPKKHETTISDGDARGEWGWSRFGYSGFNFEHPDAMVRNAAPFEALINRRP